MPYAIKPIPTPIDWSHPLAQGLVWAAAPGGDWQQDCYGRTGTLLTNGSWWASDARCPYGSALRSTNVNNGGAWWPWPERLRTIGVQFTMAMLLRLDARDYYGRTFGVPYRQGAWASPYVSIGLGNPYSSNSNTYLALEYNGAYTSRNNVLLYGDGQYHLYVGCRGGTIATDLFYRDGTLLGPGQAGYPNGNPVDWAGADRSHVALLNRSATDVEQGAAGAIGFAGIWNRKLSAAEVAALWADPFAMWRRAARRLFVAAGPGYPGRPILRGGVLGSNILRGVA